MTYGTILRIIKSTTTTNIMTTIEKIRLIAEELLDYSAPREQRLPKIVAALQAVYQMGKDDAQAPAA